MEDISVGFIGGGRVTGIILAGWKRSGQMPGRIVVSETDPAALAALKERFPAIEAAGEDPNVPASVDIVVLALHPPAIGAVLQAIAPALREDAVLVSLAPKWRIAAIAGALGAARPVVRVIPNAPSVVGMGYNPFACSPGLLPEQRERFIRLFAPLGETVETDEEKLEAYALLTAMGPTYFWFQWYELLDLAESFGLSPDEARAGLSATVAGALRTMTDAALSPAQVMDLVPVRPIAGGEEEIRRLYRENLRGLYQKLTG
ncbi:MAG: NAD(P)-binding domain-containing protein [Methanofollis liminatans]|nr:NAD(P)-binding domain-containing protein [Methanofollis liminatans]